MKLALSREEESHRTVHGGHVREGLLPACGRGTRGGSDRGAARAVRLEGASRSARAVGYTKTSMGCGVINLRPAD